jgi:hypothetical protein
MAGFELTLYGRFWVTPEVLKIPFLIACRDAKII